MSAGFSLNTDSSVLGKRGRLAASTSDYSPISPADGTFSPAPTLEAYHDTRGYSDGSLSPVDPYTSRRSHGNRRCCAHWRWWALLLLAVFFYFKLHFPAVLLARQGFSFLLPVHPDPHSLIVTLLDCSGKVFNRHGIVWFLDEGTLLGSIREARFLFNSISPLPSSPRFPRPAPSCPPFPPSPPRARHTGDVIRGDSDIDIGTFDYQQHLMPAAIAEIRATCGYYVVTRDECRAIPGFSSFIPKRIVMRILPGYFGPNWFIDVRAYHVDPDGAVYDPYFVDDNDTPFVHVRDILPLTPCALRGRTAMCPRDPVATIVDEFGDSWRTPIKGFKTYMLQREATYKLLARYNGTVEADAAAMIAAAGGATAPPKPAPTAVESAAASGAASSVPVV